MASSFNWQRVMGENKIAKQGFEPASELNGPNYKQASQSPNSLEGSASATQQKKRVNQTAANIARNLKNSNAKKRFVTLCCEALERGRPLPAPFRKLGARVRAEIEGTSSLEAWLRNQPEFKDRQKAIKACHKIGVAPSQASSAKKRLSAELRELAQQLQALEKTRTDLTARLRRKQFELSEVERLL